MFISVNYDIIGIDNGLPLIGAKPTSDPMLAYCLWNPWRKTLLKFESKYNDFDIKDACENVDCEMSFFLPQCVI